MIIPTRVCPGYTTRRDECEFLLRPWITECTVAEPGEFCPFEKMMYASSRRR